ncbi:MAG: hypothetical protein L6R42_008388, partial [Xanthoria sp. 1 TBL-2021]
MEHEQTSPTQATTQDTASHEEPQRQVGYEFPWGEDEDEDAAHRALLDLQSGVEDPAETPSSGFETLKLDLMKAIQPYNLHEITRSDESQVAVVYNE